MGIEINNVVIGGNLAKDVTMNQTPTGRMVSSLVVASNHTYAVNGEKRSEVVFIDVDVWGPMAENCMRYLQKGSPVVIIGRLKQDRWETQQGDKRSRMKIVASNVQFLPSGKKQAEEHVNSENNDQSLAVAWDG